MKFNVILDSKDLRMPTKAHGADAGFDLYSPKDFVVRCGGSAIIDTGVHFEIPPNFTGFVKSKSGLNCNYGIVCEGVIDSGYTGSVVVKLHSNEKTVYFKKGQKIAQIVFLPIPEVELVQVDSFEQTERGSNGFGSSGKF